MPELRFARHSPLFVLAWAAFAVWMLVAGVRGFLLHHPATEVLYQSLGILQVVAGFLLVATVRPREILRSRWLPALAGAGAVVSVFLVGASLAGVSIKRASSVLPVAGLGTVGGDASSLFGVAALLALSAAVVGGVRHRAALVVAGLAMSLVPFASTQRAGLIGWAAGVVALGWCLVLAARGGAAWLTGRQLRNVVVLAAGGVLVAVGLGLASSAASGSASAVFSRYDSTAKAQSSQSRINQWTAAAGLIEARPWVGNGLATMYLHYEEGNAGLVRGDLTHNIEIDAAVRGGLVGVALLVLAAASTIVSSLRLGLAGRGPLAALSVAAGVAVVELMVKGGVESIFEKPRLALTLGLALGLAACAAAWGPERRSTPPLRPARADLPPLDRTGALR